MVERVFTANERPVAVMTCPICGKMHSSEVMNESIKAALEAHPQVCERCESEQARRNAEAERQREMDAAKQKALEDVAGRIEDSNLRKYELGFDPHHAGANVSLAQWMLRNLDRSVWIYGETGTGKTRVVQHAARIVVRDRSVRYWPAYDLAARLTETSKHPEAQLRDIYGADLLILDDLGIANITEARLCSLTAIVDRRYIGWDQVRRNQGGETATFGWSSYGRRRELGGQVWITSQVSPETLVARLATVNANDAAALVRRLADMCVIHEAEAR